MKKIFWIFAVATALLFSAVVQAQNQDALLGKWWNQEKEAQIEIYSCDGKYCGKIIWLKEPNYPAKDPKGMGGQPKVDRENPDPAKRGQPILGLNLVGGFTYAGENLWEGGFIYDPREGKTYKCKMTLETPDHLKVRGFIGIALIGKTNNWTRVK
ncbi:MAG: DUF2147 domain-containing protein [Deltaproteobacteria bacterium]|jgi:uncharacterized protein (DUF2147 family)|nr:DUF2147 domain-containing protein [Deltaproteobacteria bacterium]